MEKIIHDTLTYAKQFYIELYEAEEHDGYGMCYCIQYALYIFTGQRVPVSMIVNLIPEFNPSFFGLNVDINAGFWWDEMDTESRVKAFNKLIEHYETT